MASFEEHFSPFKLLRIAHIWLWWNQGASGGDKKDIWENVKRTEVHQRVICANRVAEAVVGVQCGCFIGLQHTWQRNLSVCSHHLG